MVKAYQNVLLVDPVATTGPQSGLLGNNIHTAQQSPNFQI